MGTARYAAAASLRGERRELDGCLEREQLVEELRVQSHDPWERSSRGDVVGAELCDGQILPVSRTRSWLESDRVSGSEDALADVGVLSAPFGEARVEAPDAAEDVCRTTGVRGRELSRPHPTRGRHLGVDRINPLLVGCDLVGPDLPEVRTHDDVVGFVGLVSLPMSSQQTGSGLDVVVEEPDQLPGRQREPNVARRSAPPVALGDGLDRDGEVERFTQLRRAVRRPIDHHHDLERCCEVRVGLELRTE